MARSAFTCCSRGSFEQMQLTVCCTPGGHPIDHLFVWKQENAVLRALHAEQDGLIADAQQAAHFNSVGSDTRSCCLETRPQHHFILYTSYSCRFRHAWLYGHQQPPLILQIGALVRKVFHCDHVSLHCRGRSSITTKYRQLICLVISNPDSVCGATWSFYFGPRHGEQCVPFTNDCCFECLEQSRMPAPPTTCPRQIARFPEPVRSETALMCSDKSCIEACYRMSCFIWLIALCGVHMHKITKFVTSRECAAVQSSSEVYLNVDNYQRQEP